MEIKDQNVARRRKIVVVMVLKFNAVINSVTFAVVKKKALPNVVITRIALVMIKNQQKILPGGDAAIPKNYAQIRIILVRPFAVLLARNV